jgi:hypothetical protein
MPRYRLIPSDDHHIAIDFLASNAAQCLVIADRYAMGEADLYEDGHYRFTLRHGSDGAGCWVIQTIPRRAHS